MRDGPATFSRLLHGPPPVLPRWLDAAVERWVRLPPRVRLFWWLVVLAVLSGQYLGARGSAVTAYGPPVEVWQAGDTVLPGEPVRARRTTLPADAVPDDAVTDLPDNALAVLPIPAGTVVVGAHLNPSELVASLAPGQRVVALPLDSGSGVQVGARVDVWALDRDRGSPTLLVESRRVLAVTGERGRLSVLVAVPVEAVPDITSTLADAGVLLTLAPA